MAAWQPACDGGHCLDLLSESVISWVRIPREPTSTLASGQRDGRPVLVPFVRRISIKVMNPRPSLLYLKGVSSPRIGDIQHQGHVLKSRHSSAQDAPNPLFYPRCLYTMTMADLERHYLIHSPPGLATALEVQDEREQLTKRALNQKILVPDILSLMPAWPSAIHTDLEELRRECDRWLLT